MCFELDQKLPNLPVLVSCCLFFVVYVLRFNMLGQHKYLVVVKMLHQCSEHDGTSVVVVAHALSRTPKMEKKIRHNSIFLHFSSLIGKKTANPFVNILWKTCRF